jgi:hypothetical protein
MGRRLRTAWVAVALGLASTAYPLAHAVEAAQEVHGSADAFTLPGLALAWAVLRGASEPTTEVVIRVVADPAAFASVAAVGIDPFTRQERTLLAATASVRMVDLRVPRPHFADFPRTELRFYGTASPKPSETAKLVVFYLGVPDTTPEFVSASTFEAYLADRLARLRGGNGARPP